MNAKAKLNGALGRGRAVAGWAMGTVPGKVAQKIGQDQATNWAIVIAWNTLTSIFPIALVLAGVLGIVLQWLGFKAGSVYAIVLNVIPGNPGHATAALQTMQSKTGIFFLVGFAGLIWSASGLFGAMEQAFDVVYHVKTRGFVQQKLMALLMMLLFAALIVLDVLSSTLLGLLRYVPDLPPDVSHGATLYVIQPIVGVIAGVLLFGCLYYVVPNRPQRLGQVWPGAVVAGVAFYALTLLFPLFEAIERSGLNQYGSAFAFLFIVINFFYFFGLITMVGVELNSVLYPVPVPQPSPDAMAPAADSLPRRARRAPAPEAEPRGDLAARRGPMVAALFAALGAVIGVVAVRRHRVA
jgi:membrane protein